MPWRLWGGYRWESWLLELVWLGEEALQGEEQYQERETRSDYLKSEAQKQVMERLGACLKGEKPSQGMAEVCLLASQLLALGPARVCSVLLLAGHTQRVRVFDL